MRSGRFSFFLLVLGLLACHGEPPRRVVLSEAALSLELPAGWQLQRAEGDTLLFARPAQNGVAVASAYLILVRHAQRQAGAAPDLESYVAFSEQQSRQYALGYTLLEAGDGLVAGQAARRQLRYLKGEKSERKEFAVMWLNAGYGYQLIGAAEPKTFDRLLADYRSAAASLRALN